MKIFIRKLHKWVALLLGIQVLLWLLSGVLMAQLDTEKVSGRKWQREAPAPVPIGGVPVLEPQQLPAGLLDGAFLISLETGMHGPVYRIGHHDGEMLVNAFNGIVLTLGREAAMTVARTDFTGDGLVKSVQSGIAPDMETRESSGEYWRVNFTDPAQTSLYVSAATGDIMERRNRYWRIFDVAWMLHIMDYTGRRNFNNPVIISVALGTVWLGLSGVFLLFTSFRKKDFRFLVRNVK